MPPDKKSEAGQPLGLDPVQLVVARLQDPLLCHARMQDSSKFNEADFKILVQTIDSVMSKDFLLRHNNPIEGVKKAREAIVKLLRGNNAFHTSALRFFSMNILRELEKDLIGTQEPPTSEEANLPNPPTGKPDRPPRPFLPPPILNKQKELNQEVFDLMKNKVKYGGLIRKLTKLISQGEVPLHTENYSTLFFYFSEFTRGKKGIFRLYRTEMAEFMTAFSKKIRSSLEGLDEQNALIFFHALERLHKDVVPKEFLEVLAKKISSPHCVLSSLAISNALHCLGRLDSSLVPENLLLAITDKIRTLESMDPEDISRALNGLRELNSGVVTPELLQALTEKIEQLTEEFQPRQLGYALYGLHSLDSTVAPRPLLEAFAEKIWQSKVEFDGQSVGMMLFGLQGLDSSAVPRQLLETIAEKIRESKVDFSGQSISNGLYGLQGLDSRVVPRTLMEAFAEKIRSMKFRMIGRDVGNSLYGLQSLDNRVVPMDLIDAIGEQATSIFVELTNQDISNSLYGLWGIFGTDSKRLKQYLFQTIETRDFSGMPEVDIMTLTQIYHLYHKSSPAMLREQYEALISTQTRLPNPAEQKGFDILKKHLNGHAIHVNHLIDGFELDIYLPSKKLNIEFDGRHHLLKKGRNRRRDAYLKAAKGITTLRFDVTQEGWVERLKSLEI